MREIYLKKRILNNKLYYQELYNLYNIPKFKGKKELNSFKTAEI
jgi:hypothetical protein